MEVIASAAAREGAPTELIRSILDSLTTEEAFVKLRESDRELADRTSARIMDGIISSLRRRAGGELDIECIMYTKENGLIAASAGAGRMSSREAAGTKAGASEAERASKGTVTDRCAESAAGARASAPAARIPDAVPRADAADAVKASAPRADAADAVKSAAPRAASAAGTRCLPFPRTIPWRP